MIIIYMRLINCPKLSFKQNTQVFSILKVYTFDETSSKQTNNTNNTMHLQFELKQFCLHSKFCEFRILFSPFMTECPTINTILESIKPTWNKNLSFEHTLVNGLTLEKVHFSAYS